MRIPVKTFMMTAAMAASCLPVFADGLVPPFSEDFSDRTNALDNFIVIDGNKDGNTWVVDSEHHARVDFNSSRPMDDWMITPALRLEAGRKYPLSFTAACALAEFPERLEVFISDTPEPDAMTETLFPVFEISSKTFTTYSTDITVAETGDYYIGFHGCSARDMATLFVDDLYVGAGVQMSSPGKVDDLMATADHTGALTAEISFVTPETDLLGKPLTGLDYVVVNRDGVEIKRFNNPGMGEYLVFTDMELTEGVHTWSVAGHNADGMGLAAEATAFVGVNIPGAPTGLTLTETDNNGIITLTWEAPAVDCQGYPLNTSDITYNVYSPAGILIKEGIAGTSTSFRAVSADDGQVLVYYYVAASTRAGSQMFFDGACSSLKIVGTPTSMPYTESFAGQSASSVWHLVIPSGTGGQWQLTGMDPGAQDGDGGYAEFAPTQPGDSFTLLSEKIFIGAENPLLSFYYYSVECENEVKVRVIPVDGTDGVSASFRLADGAGWSEADVDLRPLAGKCVQVEFSYDAGYGLAGHLLLDNIVVTSGCLHNMAVTSISVPEKMAIGSDATVAVDCRNSGMEPASGYHVHLYRDGVCVTTVDGELLEPFASTTVSFIETPDLFFADAPVYHAVIEYDVDAVDGDNLSEAVTTMVMKPSYPAVSDLSAVVADGQVTLTWSAMELSGATSGPVTEDFERYDSFTIDDLGDWKLVDMDGRGTYGMGIDNMPHAGDAFAYILVDNTGFEDNPNFTSRGVSSHKYLASVCCAGEHNDDWLISPLLSGTAQEVSLWARRRAQSADYSNESFEILYSTTGIAPEDFTLAEAYGGVPYQWTRYAAQLPEGARYFAVRCTSADQMALFVDDITYTPAALGNQLAVVGYHVYRDGVRLTEEPLSVNGYTDATGDDGIEHIYHVTVVYDKGESRLSNGVSVVASGLRSPVTDDGAAVVTVRDSAVYVSAAPGEVVEIYSTGGVCVHRGVCAGTMRVALPGGIYAVRVGASVRKVVVR